MIYLDNNATTPIAPEVVVAMEPYFREVYFNPSSMYEAAQAVRRAVEQARETVAAALGTPLPHEIVWTSCATESINTALFGVARARSDRRHIITTAVEHPAGLAVCRELERSGYDVTFLGVDRDGQIDISAFVRALRTDTLCVSIMHANNETGVVFPIERLARLTKETSPHILFHCDATQSVTKLPINLSENFRHVDLLSFSGHKFHAPKGVGALFIRRGTPCRPLLVGGHQESGRRGGTENVALIVGMARAITLAAEHHATEVAHIEQLRDRLQTGLLERIPFLEVNGGRSPRTPGTLHVSCHSIEGESILYLMNDAGICASSVSACASESLEPSYVLTAMGIPFEAMHGSVRLSLSRYNTKDDVNTVLDVFPQVVEQLRRASPFWDNERACPR